MDKNSDDQFFIMQDTINSNSEKMEKQDYKVDSIMGMVKNMMDQIQISNSSTYKMDSPKSQDPTTMVPA